MNGSSHIRKNTLIYMICRVYKRLNENKRASFKWRRCIFKIDYAIVASLASATKIVYCLVMVLPINHNDKKL